MEESYSLLWLFLLIPLAFLICFPILWFFIVWMISLFGGWRPLAARYRAQQPVTGKQWTSQYGFVGSARYGNGLNITTNATGLFLEVVSLFNFNHPPLFIPWHDLHNPQPIIFRQRELIQVDVGHPPVSTLRLPAAIFEEGEGNKIVEGASIRTNVPA